ncbi:helix-turn-helix domain-containing protein [Streptomyces nanshensis]|uniref:XRE family transcriptional regulator n=1 Tax=Streptomyces nanshensis TaxID=518642 RepID=A0A1E7KZ99_9ACTN|nr:helix-turn-helix transcriptional regulator [Streptomyces nanshensis]OEV09278.1 XRE family transcriptional regulator [Streptomyces nanshensis]
MPYEEEQEAIGRRIRRQRLRLGMAQADLAHAVGKTQGWLSKVERGRQELDRTGMISQIAQALHCHPNDLIDRPYGSTTAESGQWQASAAAILRELRRYDLTPLFDGQPRPTGELWQDTRRLHRLRDAAANIAIMRSLPDLLRESRALAEVATGHEREEAFGVYAVCCKFAHTAAHALGHPELIATACERASWAAQRSGDPVLPAVADWMRVWDMWATADWDDAIALADKAMRGIEDLYEQGDPLAIRAWGSLQLRSAVSAARANNAAESDHRLSLARQAASRSETQAGPPTFDRHSLTFTRGNVQIHGINVALEMSDQTTALDLNKKLPQAQLEALPHSRRGHHRMDLARAFLWNGDREKALGQLLEAERLAPQLVRNHPIARATLRRIVYAERASTRERLRGLSARFSLSDQELFR